MPLFEVETEAHIIITWADNEGAAKHVVSDAYPTDTVIRMTKRPRDTWVISKTALGISGETEICSMARDCLSKAQGTRSTLFGSTCRKPGPISIAPVKQSSPTWLWVGDSRIHPS